MNMMYLYGYSPRTIDIDDVKLNSSGFVLGCSVSGISTRIIKKHNARKAKSSITQ